MLVAVLKTERRRRDSRVVLRNTVIIVNLYGLRSFGSFFAKRLFGLVTNGELLLAGDFSRWAAMGEINCSWMEFLWADARLHNLGGLGTGDLGDKVLRMSAGH